MPDLNELLRWSIANSTLPPSSASSSAEPSAQDDGMQLRFNPSSASASGAGAGARATLHPSDLAPPDLFPASTPGPATPVGGTLPLPAPGVGPAKRDDLTTEMLDLIMGKSDSITMKEKMEIASDTTQSVEDRVEALDDFEMLIELIDNANNMPILKLWEPLLALLSSEHQEIVAHTCWIIGTAVQNNLKAQAALYIHNALPLILSLIYPASSSSSLSPIPTPAVRAKATYALSSALKHWPLAASALSAPSASSLDPSLPTASSSSSASPSMSGYEVLRRGVLDTDPTIRRKMAFLVGALTMQSGEVYEGEIPNEVRNLIEEKAKTTSTSESLVERLREEGIYAALIHGFNGSGDVEYEENAILALKRASDKGGLTGEQKSEVRGIWEQWGTTGQEERGISGQDAKDVASAFA